MRPTYFILRLTLPYVFSIFFRKRMIVNYQWKFKRQAIFVCNHPSSFLDPLFIANSQWSVVHFMTRSDVFKSWLKPITWASHMLPIYRRAQDGDDSHEKNLDVFKNVRRILIRKRSLIMFGEGYTDDIFIRRLKPLKKGPGRIGFETMEACNWEQDIKIIPVSLNYANPGVFRSDVIIIYGDPIPLKNYKEVYNENPNRAITQLMRDVDIAMKKNLVHIEDKANADFLEQVLMVSKKGMNWQYFNRKDTMISRFQYSKRVAEKINNEFGENEKLGELKTRLSDYFKASKNISQNWIERVANGKSAFQFHKLIFLILFWPLAIVGAIHCLIPYLLIKRFVEKSFKRKVFWSGVKIVLGALFACLINLPIIWLFHAYIYPSYWLAVLYFLIVPPTTWLIAYGWAKTFKEFLKWNKTDVKNVAQLAEERKELLKMFKQFDF